jgi:hypothetical protein
MKRKLRCARMTAPLAVMVSALASDAIAAAAPNPAAVPPHPAATEHLPLFITSPGQTDVLLVVMAFILLASVVAFGTLFLRLHTLPERIAHKGHKLQFEIVAVLGLLALFTHIHWFWVAGLLLALIDIPDFSGGFERIAGSMEKIAGVKPDEGTDQAPDEAVVDVGHREGVTTIPASPQPASVGTRS